MEMSGQTNQKGGEQGLDFKLKPQLTSKTDRLIMTAVTTL
jgi:hypothetical protein